MSKKKDLTPITDSVDIHSGLTLITRVSAKQLAAEGVSRPTGTLGAKIQDLGVSKKAVANALERASAHKPATSKSSPFQKRGRIGYKRVVNVEIHTSEASRRKAEPIPVEVREGDRVLISADTPLGDVFDASEDLVVVIKGYAVPAFEQLLEIAADATEERLEQQERVINSLMPVDVPSAAETEQLRLNAQLRTQFLKTVACYTSEELADRAGSSAQNKAQWASRFKREGRIFAVTQDGQSYFPAFQFDSDYKPKPIIRQILSALSARGLTGWEVALWFLTNSSFLGGRNPHDLIDKEPQLTLEAATFESPW